jgi:hypothetical protein
VTETVMAQAAGIKRQSYSGLLILKRPGRKFKVENVT